MQFTKEQLTEVIESADDVIKALAGTHDDIHPHSDAMCRAWDWLNDNSAPPEVVKRLAEIALKELTDSGKLAAAEQRIAELESINDELAKFPDQIINYIAKLGTSEIGGHTKNVIYRAAQKVKDSAASIGKGA